MNGLTLLTILFIGLKLSEIIKWSWVWVLSPIWVGPVFLLLALVVASIFPVFKNPAKRRKR